MGHWAGWHPTLRSVILNRHHRSAADARITMVGARTDIAPPSLIAPLLTEQATMERTYVHRQLIHNLHRG
jgi:hypothetical protein